MSGARAAEHQTSQVGRAVDHVSEQLRDVQLHHAFQRVRCNDPNISRCSSPSIRNGDAIRAIKNLARRLLLQAGIAYFRAHEVT